LLTYSAVEITHLRYFVHVAASESFSRGARLAHVSPPAMTKAIQKLEDEVGARLFERTTRRVLLTEAGQALLRRARAALAEVDGIRKDLDDLDANLAGELRIGAMEVFSLRALPRALTQLVSLHPAVVPHAFEMHPETIQRHVAEGQLDIGFTIGRGSWKGVRTEILGASAGRVVCGRAHPLFRGRRIGPADLARHPFVVPRFFQQEHLPALDEFPEERYPRRVGATIELLQMGVELVVAGKLLGCFPEVSIDHLVKSKELAVLEGLRGLPRFELLALTREGVAPKRAAVALVALLRAGLRIDRTPKA
jgi:DNA-binding transcriptional LysR family regulator